MKPGERLDFTFRYAASDHWIGVDHHLAITADG